MGWCSGFLEYKRNVALTRVTYGFVWLWGQINIDCSSVIGAPPHWVHKKEREEQVIVHVGQQQKAL